MPLSGRVCEGGRQKYIEIKNVRKEVKDLKQEERLGNPPERYDQITAITKRFFRKT